MERWDLNIMTICNRNFWRRLKRDETAAVNEFLGLILFVAVVLGVLIPVSVEMFIYNNQAQELDRLTKLSATRACTLLADPTQGVASDLNQSSLGVGADINIMQSIVNAVFKNEAAHPEVYFENTPDKSNIELKIYDLLGEQIDITTPLNKLNIDEKDGSSKEILLVGTNSGLGLCPAGGATKQNGGWKYCMNKANDSTTVNALNNTGQAPNQDLIARLEKLQPGRCGGTTACADDFFGRIDRCSVCATKSRESFFAKSSILGMVLFLKCDPNNPNLITLLPCKMKSCASAKFVQYSGNRGYAPNFRSPINLGDNYVAAEVSPDAATPALSSPSAALQKPGQLFCMMNQDFGGLFADSLGGGGCQSVYPTGIPSK